MYSSIKSWFNRHEPEKVWVSNLCLLQYWWKLISENLHQQPILQFYFSTWYQWYNKSIPSLLHIAVKMGAAIFNLKFAARFLHLLRPSYKFYYDSLFSLSFYFFSFLHTALFTVTRSGRQRQRKSLLQKCRARGLQLHFRNRAKWVGLNAEPRHHDKPLSSNVPSARAVSLLLPLV